MAQSNDNPSKTAIGAGLALAIVVGASFLLWPAKATDPKGTTVTPPNRHKKPAGKGKAAGASGGDPVTLVRKEMKQQGKDPGAFSYKAQPGGDGKVMVLVRNKANNKAIEFNVKGSKVKQVG